MNTMWLPLSLSTAFLLATADALTKKFFGDLSAYEMGLARLFFSLPFLVSAYFFIGPASPDRTFWLCIAAGLPLEAAAFFSYMKALKASPLSLSLPFLAFSPLFMIVTGRIVLGERIGAAGCAGIALIVAGSYLLNLSQASLGPLAPFKAVLKEPGSRYMLFAAFLYSFTSVIGKKAIEHSSPLFFSAVHLGDREKGDRAQLAAFLLRGLFHSVRLYHARPVSALPRHPHAKYLFKSGTGICGGHLLRADGVQPHYGDFDGSGRIHDIDQAAEPDFRSTLRGNPV